MNLMTSPTTGVKSSDVVFKVDVFKHFNEGTI